jgi:hypothetical protein
MRVGWRSCGGCEVVWAVSGATLVAGRGGVGVDVRAAGAGLAAGGRAGVTPDRVGERSVLLAAQLRSGRVRSRANALASLVAHGQERCSRRMTRRAWRTTRAATCHSR